MMTFTSTAVEPADTGWRVTGTLTARSVTTRLTGMASIVDGSDDGRRPAGRRKLGIRVPGFLVGRFVNIQYSDARRTVIMGRPRAMIAGRVRPTR